MFICYIDEAGCTGVLPTPSSPIQPVFILVGAIIEQSKLAQLTDNFLSWKKKFFPNRSKSHDLDNILVEIKGCDLRRQIRGTGDKRKFALKVLDEFLENLEKNQVRMIGRVWIKGIGQPFSSIPVYTSSVQYTCACFENFCLEKKSQGIIIADSRNQPDNQKVAHSVFTKMYKTSGNAYPNLIEIPLFGHSENHAGIQIVDLLCSGFLFPMATYGYCTGHVTNNMHLHGSFWHIQHNFGRRLKNIQYKYPIKNGMREGIIVSDPISCHHSGYLFGTV